MTAPPFAAGASSARTARAGAAIACFLLLAGGCSSPGDRSPEPLQGVVELQERGLGFEAGGRLAALPVERGDPVEAGAELARLDDTFARLQRDAAEATLSAARARLALLQAGARSGELRARASELRAARSRAETIEHRLRRQRLLLEGGAGTSSSVEDLETEAASSRAQADALAARYGVARDGARVEELAMAEAEVAAGRAQLRAAEERLARTSLRADRPGVVVDLLAEAGEVVGSGRPVVVLADPSRPSVDVFVPQAAIGEVRIGDRAGVTADLLAGASLEGTVEHIARATEFTPRYLFSDRERPNLVVRVRVRIDDPEQRLRAGVPAFVEWIR